MSRRDVCLIGNNPLIDGYCSMSTDELLLDCRNEDYGNIWRFYLWNPPAVSIGRNQDAEFAVRLDVVREEGFEIVRRPTGGRAIWHKGDVCFTCAGWNAGLAAPLDEYEMVSKAVVSFLRRLGLDAEISRGSALDRLALSKLKAPCYQSSGRFEVTVRGKKIAGIAQYRTHERFLIQGSIRVRTMDDMERHLFYPASDEGRAAFERMRASVRGIGEHLNREIRIDELSDAFVSAVGVSAGDGRFPHWNEIIERSDLAAAIDCRKLESDKILRGNRLNV